MSTGFAGFVDLCVKELELCAVREGETVAVLSQANDRLEYADAFMTAATRLGATPFHVRLPEASTTLLGDAGAGTVVVYQLSQYGVMTEYGFTDTPGRWDHWPSGFLFTGGDDDGVDGKVVL